MSEEDTEDGETQSTQTRHWLTNDYIAAFIVVMFAVLLALEAFQWLDLQSAPTAVLWAWVFGFLTAIIWVFGGAAAKTAFDAIGGGQ